MEKIGVIGGSILLNSSVFKGAIEEKIKTPYGECALFIKNNLILVLRHGKNNDIPPHKINHRANIYALKEKGIKKIVSITSVGSLRKNIMPGDIVVPHDYIEFFPPTFFDGKITHITPGISNELRKVVIKAAKMLKIKIIEKGVYFKTRGPRLETKAEINMLKRFADVVGMTMAPEATLAKELGIEYAAISSVDNYCNGIMPKSKDLTNEEIEKNRAKNIGRIEKLLEKTIWLLEG
ncbi:MAG: MTAP family purine nucleoside phosphorylase [Candidatus Woesearchaeota archaeon]|nr:MTAP family purine nucleoside phosphorylase [Candidatus Woesearchaeota archaeon]